VEIKPTTAVHVITGAAQCTVIGINLSGVNRILYARYMYFHLSVSRHRPTFFSLGKHVETLALYPCLTRQEFSPPYGTLQVGFEHYVDNSVLVLCSTNGCEFSTYRDPLSESLENIIALLSGSSVSTVISSYK